MAAAPHSLIPDRHRPDRRSAVSSRRPRGNVMPSRSESHSSSRTRSRSSQQREFQAQTPAWLRSLMTLQRTSNLLCFFLIASTLGAYAWTVYTQQMWSQEYRKLETLQRHERQMTAANEALKNQLAQEAELPGTGLVAPNPANTIFLPPAPQRQSLPKPVAAPNLETSPTTPLGY
ncbi:hypothetical protein [Coleofasciculus sp. FACHB-1120]|uniref:hypothetical protein n=1 Tax=Coleofasciculus sp. FACHB-1120 TaxID=2692783 RepID=UPI0016890C16|nr:hypothetical protein [Coleofasciculus sp. FACHB-1120]MBD2741151.1 hypothetical protein [Coleofasciculus sp. FACHB-1120]